MLNNIMSNKTAFFIFLTLTLVVSVIWYYFENTKDYIKDLESNNIVVRDQAVYYLGEKEEEEAVPILIKLLKTTESIHFKTNIIKALEKIGDNRAVDSLIEVLLNEKNYEHKMAAIEALGKIKDIRAVPHLVKHLEDKDFQLVVIWALGNIGDEVSLEVLSGLLDNKDKYVRYNAIQSLKKISTGD